MTKNQLMKQMKNMSKEDLEILISNLFESSSTFKDIVSEALNPADADKMFEKYRKKLEKSFDRTQSFSLNECKRVLANYCAITTLPDKAALMNYYFAQYAAYFSRSYGDIGSSFYKALVDKALVAFHYGEDHIDFFDEHRDQFENLIKTCGCFGWGVESSLKQEYKRIEKTLK